MEAENYAFGCQSMHAHAVAHVGLPGRPCMHGSINTTACKHQLYLVLTLDWLLPENASEYRCISGASCLLQTAGLVYTGTNNNTLTVFISASQPALGTAQYANWLPAPSNAPIFFLLRTYEPPSYVLSGGYAPPAFIPITSPSVASAGK